MNEEFPKCVVDSWKVKPPCESSFDYCPVQCPYYYECFSDVE